MTRDQQREERRKTNEKEQKNKGERLEQQTERTEEVQPPDFGRHTLRTTSVSGPRRVALLFISVLRKAAGRWPADVYHLVLIVGLDQVVRERWPFIWQRSGFAATLSLSETWCRTKRDRIDN